MTTPNDGYQDPSAGEPGGSHQPYGAGYGQGGGSGHDGGYGQPTPPQGGVGLAVAALVCGILAILTACFWFIAIPLGIVAAVLGFIARSKAKKGEARGGGMGLTGAILGIVGAILGILVVAGVATLVGLTDDCDPEGPQAEYQQCVTDSLS